MRFARARTRLFGSRLARQTVAYGVMNGISTAITVAVGPILTHYLLPSDYGIAALFVAAFNFLDPVAGLGLIGALRRRYFQREKYHYPSYVLSASLVCFAQSALLTVLLWASYPLWGTRDVHRLWAVSFLPWVIGRYLMAAVAAQLQLEGRPLGFGMFTWANSLVNVGATLGLVVVFGYGWEGRVLGQVIAAVAVGLAAALVLAKLVGPGARRSWALAKDAVVLGAPGVPYALLDRIIQFADRVLITAIAGIEQAGLYTLGSQVSGLMTRGATSINLAWQPWLFERLNEGTPKAARRVVLAFYVASTAMLGLGVSLWLAVRWLFPLLIGDRFSSAVTLLPWLCIGLALRGIAGLLSGLIVYSDKTAALTQIATATALVHLLALGTLLTWKGTEGAAQAAFLAYACNLSFVWWRARRLVPLAGL